MPCIATDGAAPGNDLVRSDKGRVCLIEIAGIVAIDIDNGQIEPEAARRLGDVLRNGTVAAQAQQRPLETERVVERAPVGKPEMGRPPAGTCRWRVGVGGVGGWNGPI